MGSPIFSRFSHKRTDMRTLRLISLAAFATSLAAAATAQAPMPGRGSMPGMAGQMDPAAMQKVMQDMMPADADAASTKAFKNAHMGMMKNMHVPFTAMP